MCGSYRGLQRRLPFDDILQRSGDIRDQSLVTIQGARLGGKRKKDRQTDRSIDRNDSMQKNRMAGTASVAAGRP